MKNRRPPPPRRPAAPTQARRATVLTPQGGRRACPEPAEGINSANDWRMERASIPPVHRQNPRPSNGPTLNGRPGTDHASSDKDRSAGPVHSSGWLYVTSVSRTLRHLLSSL